MMKRFFFSLFCLLLTLICFTTRAQQKFKTTPGSVIGYLEYLPPDYHSSPSNFPVVIFLHGMGEKGPNSKDPKKLEDGINLITKHGPPKHVKNGTQFPFILISPQLKAGVNGWRPDYVMEVIDHVVGTLRIDRSRIYLTGMSMGGFGTWLIAETYPDLFAAIAPVCGGGNPSKAKDLANANLPVWAFHGDDDRVVPAGRSIAMVNAINANNPRTQAKISIYPKVKHDSWNNAYQPDHSIHNPNVYEWLLSHRKNGSQPQETPPPVVSAGEDKVLTLPNNTVVLEGTAKSQSGNIKTVSWQKISGPAVVLEGENISRLSLKDLLEGVYEFRFAAADDKGKSASDNVRVTVMKAAAAPQALTVFAGDDVTISLPTTAITLQGKVTPEQSVKSMQWSKISGGVATLHDANTPTLKITDLAEGKYVFRLEVTGEQGTTGKDDVQITVRKAEMRNQMPLVNAGPDIRVTMPQTTINLSGSATDPDGQIVSFIWKKIAGPDVHLQDTDKPSAHITEFGEGQYTFSLTVADDKGGSASDVVVVVIQAQPSTISSGDFAYAGEDQSVRLPINEVILQGDTHDLVAHGVEYKWKQLAGPRVTLTGETSAEPMVTNIKVPGVLVFQLEVNHPERGIDLDEVRVFVSEGRRKMVDPDDQAGLDKFDPATLDLAHPDEEQFKDLSVVVFNDRGEKIFAGPWKDSSYQEVFAKQGFYIYHIIQGDQRVDVGKLIIRP